MSLIVSIISKDKEFDTSNLEKEISSPHNDLFGFEEWRKSVWGHKVMFTIGCELIYSLRESNVYVFDEDVINLKNELSKLLDNIEQIVKETNIDRSSIEFRVKNALEAIRVAEKNLDKVGVALW
jgi:hypothetical protein